MKFDEKADEFIFESTGRKEYANLGIIGIEEEGLGITYGYDGSFPNQDLAPEERIELADYMIDLWQKFKSNE